MLKKHLLASLLATLGWAGLAYAQSGLGAPVTPAKEPAPSGDCFCGLPRPAFGAFARSLLLPFRPVAEMPPQPPPIVETTPTREDIGRMIADGGYSLAEITAAKIKVDESHAKARQAAVRYLATVDCHYYPEAETGLIAALRADRSESVRHEAAVALGACRGTTRRIIEALSLTALGQEMDGNPAETSDRVRQAARESLNRLLSSGMALAPVDAMPTSPLIDWSGTPSVQPTSHTVPLLPAPVVEATSAERELAETVSATTPSTRVAPPAPRSLIEWIMNYTSSRQHATARTGIDPRLRGLRPLGSETMLAIPTTPATSNVRHASPYND